MRGDRLGRRRRAAQRGRAGVDGEAPAGLAARRRHSRSAATGSGRNIRHDRHRRGAERGVRERQRLGAAEHDLRPGRPLGVRARPCPRCGRGRSRPRRSRARRAAAARRRSRARAAGRSGPSASASRIARRAKSWTSSAPYDLAGAVAGPGAARRDRSASPSSAGGGKAARLPRRLVRVAEPELPELRYGVGLSSASAASTAAPRPPRARAARRWRARARRRARPPR